jgi:hypothetical protein
MRHFEKNGGKDEIHLHQPSLPMSFDVQTTQIQIRTQSSALGLQLV